MEERVFAISHAHSMMVITRAPQSSLQQQETAKKSPAGSPGVFPL
jgi:hypothetical protein